MRMATGVLVVLAAALLAGCSGSDAGSPAATAPVKAARPQRAELDWVERYPEKGPGLVFRVSSFAVTKGGWEAEIAFDNASGAHWELPEAQEAYKRVFGVMLFATDGLEELERLNKDGQLPTVRRADRFAPPLVTFLPAGESWKGRISARGALPAGTFVRIVFGPFIAVADPPKGMDERVIWITDEALELRP